MLLWLLSLVFTAVNWWCVRYCAIYGCPSEAGEGLWYHAIILNVTFFFHLVHRQ